MTQQFSMACYVPLITLNGNADNQAAKLLEQKLLEQNKTPKSYKSKGYIRLLRHLQGLLNGAFLPEQITLRDSKIEEIILE